MPKSYDVKLGDCIASLSFENGFGDHALIYDDPANADLKRARPNPDVLAEGDVVSIPDLKVKEEEVPLDKTHVFKVKVVETLLRVVATDDGGNAVAGKKYKLTVGAAVFEGSTPGDGKIEHPIAPGARAGTLELWLQEGDGIDGYLFPLEIGSLEHESKDRACQARLLNLGFECGGVGGTVDAHTQEALHGFQKKNGLAVNGTLDATTRAKLRVAHEGA